MAELTCGTYARRRRAKRLRDVALSGVAGGLLVGATACSETSDPAANSQSAETDEDAASPGLVGQEGQGDASSTLAARLFFLDISGGRVLAMDADGENFAVLVETADYSPDGIAVDTRSGHIYWSNMGVAAADDGSIQRSRLDGTEVEYVVEPGGLFTGKQLELEPSQDKLYWSDREGMRVMRCNLDGSNVETLVTVAEGDAARADASNWAVGIAVDVEGGHVYWTQKGPDNGNTGSIRRAALELPAGETSRDRTDIEVLFEALPEPIDLDLDLQSRTLYWTDRGDNTVNRASMDPPAGATPSTRADREILVTGLSEAIGIAVDLESGLMYYTDLSGHVGRATIDGGDPVFLRQEPVLTGIALARVPE